MASRKRIGLLIPSTNTTCEADFQMVVPRGFSVHGQRLWLTNDALGDEGMVRMNAEIETGARYLATARVDAISYGCTTGSFFKGPGWDRDMIALIERTAGVPAVAASPSVVEALRTLGARRISVATPYPEWNNTRLRAYLEAQGFDVLNLEAEPVAARAGNQGINDQEPDVGAEFASRACRADADALLCSCTAWRSVEAAEEIEQRTGKPVVTSNQASIWLALRRLGHAEPIAGFGRLLRMFAPRSVAGGAAMGYVITNVRILDGTGAAPFAGTVRMDGNRIVEVTRGAGSAPPAGASVLDGAGAMLMPGLIECMIMKDGALHKSP